MICEGAVQSKMKEVNITAYSEPSLICGDRAPVFYNLAPDGDEWSVACPLYFVPGEQDLGNRGAETGWASEPGTVS